MVPVVKTSLQLDGGDVAQGYRYYRLEIETQDAQRSTLAYVFVSNEAGTVTLADGTKLVLPEFTESWYVSPSALDVLSSGQAAAMNAYYFASMAYDDPGPAVSLDGFSVKESTPSPATFAAASSWPDGGSLFYNDTITAETVPTAVSFVLAFDGSAIDQVAWYIPEAQEPDPDAALFSAFATRSGEESYGADAPPEPPTGWLVSTSTMTVVS